MKIREVGFVEYAQLARAYMAAVKLRRPTPWSPAPYGKVHELGIFGVQAGVGLRYGG